MKKILIICVVALAFVAFVYPLRQTKIVGREVNSACAGIVGLGFRKVRYTTISYSSWESLAHYDTRCFFWFDLKKSIFNKSSTVQSRNDSQKIGVYINEEYDISFNYLPVDMKDIIHNGGVKQNETHIAHISRFLNNYLIIDIYRDEKDDEIGNSSEMISFLKKEFSGDGYEEVSNHDMPAREDVSWHVVKVDKNPSTSPSHLFSFAVIEREEDIITLLFFVPTDEKTLREMEEELGYTDSRELVKTVINSITW